MEKKKEVKVFKKIVIILLLAFPLHLISQDADDSKPIVNEKEYDFTSDGYMYFVIIKKGNSFEKFIENGGLRPDKNGYFKDSYDSLIYRFNKTDINPLSNSDLKVRKLMPAWVFSSGESSLKRDSDYVHFSYNELHRRTLETESSGSIGGSIGSLLQILLVDNFNFEALIQRRQKELIELRKTNKF